MAERLTLQTNVPQVIALAYGEGREIPSKIPGAPPQYMFTLTDGRVDWWPKPFAEQLREAGIRANVPFEICKRETDKGKTQLQFRPVRAAAPPPPPPPPAAVHTEPPDPWSGASYSDQRPATRVVPQTAPAQTAATPTSSKLLAAYMLSVDTLLETQVYAKRKGLDLVIATEDVRALAATILIDQQKGGR